MKLLSAAEKFKKIHGHFPQTDEEINLIKTNLSEEYRDRIRYMNYGSSNRGTPIKDYTNGKYHLQSYSIQEYPPPPSVMYNNPKMPFNKCEFSLHEKQWLCYDDLPSFSRTVKRPFLA